MADVHDPDPACEVDQFPTVEVGEQRTEATIDRDSGRPRDAARNDRSPAFEESICGLHG
jgi:hypothetical protein